MLYSTDAQLLARTYDRSTDKTLWRAVEAQSISRETVPMPAPFLARERRRARDGFTVDEDDLSDPEAGRVKDGYVWAGTRRKDDLKGLWLERKSGDPELIVRGWFGEPVFTPDGEWLVAAKCIGENWGEPNDLVRIHLSDGREERIDLAPADDLDAVAWIPAHGKVLIRRAKDELHSKAGPGAPEFYLLDPATGELTKVNGDFRPFQERASHKLQPANAVDEVWTALPSALEEAPETVVGRYNTRNFTFVERLRISGVRFSNTEMRVDESKHRLTFITNGDVLRLALPE